MPSIICFAISICPSVLGCRRCQSSIYFKRLFEALTKNRLEIFDLYPTLCL